MGFSPIAPVAQRLLVGMIGVGNMGAAMATRLLGAGGALTAEPPANNPMVYDLSLPVYFLFMQATGL
jgi:hypothetical protein